MAYQVKLTEGEESIAMDFISGNINLATGEGLLEAFCKAYPRNEIGDHQKRYKCKAVLKRETVKAYIEQVQQAGGVTANITADKIRQYLWETAINNKNKTIGLNAAIQLGKEYGVGIPKQNTSEDRSFDIMLREIHKYNDALGRGEKPSMPAILTDSSNVANEIDFEIVEDENDE